MAAAIAKHQAAAEFIERCNETRARARRRITAAEERVEAAKEALARARSAESERLVSGLIGGNGILVGDLSITGAQRALEAA